MVGAQSRILRAPERFLSFSVKTGWAHKVDLFGLLVQANHFLLTYKRGHTDERPLGQARFSWPSGRAICYRICLTRRHTSVTISNSA